VSFEFHARLSKKSSNHPFGFTQKENWERKGLVGTPTNSQQSNFEANVTGVERGRKSLDFCKHLIGETGNIFILIGWRLKTY